jgi:hypothetical protein
MYRIEISYFEDFTRFGPGTAHDELENAFILGSPADFIQTGLQLGYGQMLRAQGVGPLFNLGIVWITIAIMAYSFS